MSAKQKELALSGPTGAKQPELPLTFSVGDWVWAKHHGRNARVFLARIESANSIRAGRREVWLVRIYRSGRGWKPSAEHREVRGPLNAAEVAHNRKIGLIPAAGEALP